MEKTPSAILVGLLSFLLALPPALALLPSSALARDAGERLLKTTRTEGTMIFVRGGDRRHGGERFWDDHRRRGGERFWDDHGRHRGDRFRDDHSRRRDRHDRFFRDRHDDFFFGYDRRYRGPFPYHDDRFPRDHFRYDRGFPDYSVCFRSGSTLLCVR